MIGPALFAFALTTVCAGPAIAILRRANVIDLPSSRRSHDKPTVRGGGVAPAVGSLAGLLVSTQITGDPRSALLVAVVGFGVIGLAEDLRGVSPLVRLASQLLVAAAVLPWLLSDLTGPGVWRAAVPVVVVVWVVGYVNAFNFMDGINGISAAQVVVAGGALYFVADHAEIPGVQAAALIVVAAALAFAPWNFPRARMFLGDSGSYFLGAWLAIVVVVALRHGTPLEAAGASLVLYVADTAVTFVRRVLAGGAWAAPHRDHAYQRLVKLGWSHAQATAFVLGVTAVCAALGAVSLTNAPVARVVADLALAAVVGGYLLSPTLLGRRTAAGRS